MNPVKLSNELLYNYISLMDKINELPNHLLEGFLKEYVPLSENADFNYLQFLRGGKSNKNISAKENSDIHKIITIVSDIDSAINEYLRHYSIDTLKGILKNISNTYEIKNRLCRMI